MTFLEKNGAAAGDATIDIDAVFPAEFFPDLQGNILVIAYQDGVGAKLENPYGIR